MARKSRKGIHKLPVVEPKVFNAGLYARISMNSDGKSLSVLNQIEHMRKFLSQHEDIIPTEIYADDGVSSFSKNRPAFARMIEDIYAKKIDCIIVNEISRFSRKYIEASEYLEITFPTLQVRFISILDEYDSINGVSTSFVMMLKTILAYTYARDISRKVASHIENQQRTGTYTPSRLPYGYQKIRINGSVEWSIDRTTELVVKRIFEMAQSQKSSYSIAKELNIQCIPSPNGKYWTVTGIRRILTNRTYLGELITHKTKNELLISRTVIQLPKSQWLYHKDHHPPIVDDALFDSVQQQFSQDKFIIRNIPKETFFQGKLYCGVCNRKLRPKRASDGAFYYICPLRNETGGACDNKSRRVNKIKAMVYVAIVEKIQRIREQKDKVVQFEQSLYFKHKEKQTNRQLDDLKRVLSYQERFTLEMYEAYVDAKGSAVGDDLLGLFRHMLDVKNHFGERIAGIEKELFDNKVKRSMQAAQLDMILQYELTPELTSEMLEVLVERISLFPDGVEVSFRGKREN